MDMNKEHKKKQILNFENSLYSGLDLTQEELAANEKFLQMVKTEESLFSREFYSTPIFLHKEKIQHSPVYKLLKKLPKGVLHHQHFDAAWDNDFFIQEIAFHPNTYFSEQTMTFKYFKEDPKNDYKTFNKRIEEGQDKEQLIKQIRQYISVVEDDVNDYSKHIWNTFESKIQALWQLTFFVDFFKLYLRKSLQLYVDEGIYRVEVRGFLNTLFDENQKVIPVEEEIAIYNEVVEQVKKENNLQEFSYGFIVQGLKMWDDNQLIDYLEEAVKAKKKFPEFIQGFDMVQEEDKFRNMTELYGPLSKLKEFEAKYEVELPFVLHGGESLKFRNNTNLFDILKLGTKRIGHGINLLYFPELLEEVKQKQICLEICPVSNQALGYCQDLRNHPARVFLNHNVPISISNDDPSFFGLKGVAYDYYALAFCQEFDLRDFKKCSLNSIKHALTSEAHKESLKKMFLTAWNNFIKII